MGEAGPVTDIAFSPPAPEPMGITIGVASLADRMYLTLRYRKSVLDATAAAAFGELLKQTLLA
jgi:hypothetical protein